MKNVFEIRGDITTIILKSPKYGIMETLISTSKLERAMMFPGTWGVAKNKSGFYVQGQSYENGKEKTIYLHRFITNAPPGYSVDHINRNPLDNRDENLRIVTHAENLQNQKVRVDNRTGYRGVTYMKEFNKYRARIRVNGEYIYLGYYDTAEEAAEVASQARSKMMPFSQDANYRGKMA
jgi:hypothetical protein